MSNEREEATEALVLMVVGVNDNFKLPIAYFFVNKITGEEKANIVLEALRFLHPTGVKILSLTCDGPKVHFKMMNVLGCRITDPDNFKTNFNHPVDGSLVHVFFDVCHMIKLVQNNWVTTGTFVSPDGELIKWDYIVKLHHMQENEGLYLGNRLRKKHIKWHQAKMNVSSYTIFHDMKFYMHSIFILNSFFFSSLQPLYPLLDSIIQLST